MFFACLLVVLLVNQATHVADHHVAQHQTKPPIVQQYDTDASMHAVER